MEAVRDIYEPTEEAVRRKIREQIQAALAEGVCEHRLNREDADAEHWFCNRCEMDYYTVVGRPQPAQKKWED